MLQGKVKLAKNTFHKKILRLSYRRFKTNLININDAKQNLFYFITISSYYQYQGSNDKIYVDNSARNA